ncbi:MAG: hypothetical protein ABJC10_00215 [Acidobacteriota bacterium]
MITGFNTDIEHDGVVYHVQTEDKGLDSPLILSLVYVGGAILAAKRARYDDLIEAGFTEEVLTKRLKRQHSLICAAINAGRIADLKRMGSKPEEVASIAAIESDVQPVADERPARNTAPLDERLLPARDQPAVAEESVYTVYDPRRQAPPAEVLEPENGVTLTILDEEEFQAGEAFTIHIQLIDRSGKKEKPLAGVALSLKVLGTAFRPQIYSAKTERGGFAEVPVTMPTFSSGRAAVLVRAMVKGETIEVRRVIHPGQ